MDDVAFLQIAESVVHFVDEKFGRLAAWIAAIAMVIAPVALIWSIIAWMM
jgi:hypothetical protein